MTQDGLLVLRSLFTTIWSLFTSFLIPGTNTTPAEFAFFLVFSVLLVFSVYAVDEEGGGSSESVNAVYIVSSDTSASGSYAISPSDLLGVLKVFSESQKSQQLVPSDLDLVNVSILRSVAPVTPSDASGLKAVLLEFIGDYDPVIVEYEYRNQNSQYSSYLREVQPDYPWLVSCALLIVVIYCIFRLGGALFCKR